MKIAKKRFAGITHRLSSADGHELVGNKGAFLLLTVSLIAACTLALSPLVSGGGNWGWVLMHGMVVLNGGAS